MLSALLSPIMMLIQSRFVLDVFFGRDSGWNAQKRDDVGISLTQAVRSHWLHTLVGVGAGLLAFSISVDDLPVVLADRGGSRTLNPDLMGKRADGSGRSGLLS